MPFLGNKGFGSKEMVTNPIGWLRGVLSDATRGLEWFAGRYYGVYEGQVIDNQDPEDRGRVRALCPVIKLNKKEDVSGDFWALPTMPGLGVDPDSKQMSGLFNPPDVGMNVWIMFRHGNPEYPVYMGGWMTANKASDTFDSENTYKRGFRTRAGHFLRMDDDPENLGILISKGDGDGTPTAMYLSMDATGGCTLTNENGSTLFMNGEKPETSIMTANESGEVTAMLMLGDDKITLATKSGGAIGIDGKDTTITGDNMVADMSKEFVANAGAVKLGKNATEPAVRGMKFMQWSLIHQHTITTPTPGSPTATGATPPPMMYNELSPNVFIG